MTMLFFLAEVTFNLKYCDKEMLNYLFEKGIINYSIFYVSFDFLVLLFKI